MDDCIFCKIISGKIPCAKLYDDKDYIAFLDIAPANKGHALIVPKKHYETTLDIPLNEFCEMMGIVQKMSKKIKDSLKADGFNIFINNKKAAGQVVPHLHAHIVPRFETDGIKFGWPHQKFEDGEIEQYQKKLVMK